MSTLQSIVALSTTEAEYMAITEAVKETIWLHGLYTDQSSDIDGLLLGIQQTIDIASLSNIDGLICQEKIAKEELGHALHLSIFRRNNSSGIHRLRIDNEVIEDPKLIKDHILDFYKNLYTESISNVWDTSNMEDFIGAYIPKLVSSEESMIMNSNVVSLIPKIKGIESIKDSRPIVVANFKFKIISKILADRLALVAARIISPNQYGFV
ncbi:uncharacterized protein [Phaseolus vulgaris]|uniref:uncharacterized protein n=1 Tax=Phaseolus vulgaris TaxID=3885 RepID=UPI0035CA2BCE